MRAFAYLGKIVLHFDSMTENSNVRCCKKTEFALRIKMMKLLFMLRMMDTKLSLNAVRKLVQIYLSIKNYIQQKYEVWLSHNIACKTKEGDLCLYPFKWWWSTYDSCVTCSNVQCNAPDTWCATELNSDLTYKKWGRCDSSCDIAGTCSIFLFLLYQ